MVRFFRILPILCLTVCFSFSHSVLAQSAATAEYRVTFTGNWTLASTPGGVVGSAHFTTIAGGKHNSSVSFWSPGQQATSGLESLAELGSTSGFINEINSSSHTDTSFTAGVSGGGTGTSTFTLNVKRTHPLITLASMIGPSPDWFVGLHDYSLLDSNNNWVSSVSVDLFPYDAGTEDGNEFTLSNPATSPQGVITSLRGTGKFSNVRMARISFTRQNVPPPPSAPTITAIERPSSIGQTTNADSVNWLITFSESVQNVSTGDFVVNGTTATVTYVSLVTGSSTQYELTVSGGNLASLDGSISLALSTSQDITNSSNVSLSTTLPSGAETYTIDNTAPSVSSVLPLTSKVSPFTVRIRFDEELQSGSLTSSDDVSSDDATVSTPTGGNRSYEVSITPNDPAQPGTITLTIAAGAGTDIAGNPSNEHEVSIEYAPEIQHTAATVTSVSAITPNGLYYPGDEIEIAVAFSASVTVTGVPTLALQFDNGSKDAQYNRGSDTARLVFAYTLKVGDSTSDLRYVGTQSLKLGEGTIIGDGNLAADLALPAPGTAGSLSRNSAIEASGEANTTPSFENAAAIDRVYIQGSQIAAFTLPTAVRGNGEITYELETPLPTGLVFTVDPAQISGTPIEPSARSSFLWSATDEDGDSAKFTFFLTVLEDLSPTFTGDTSVSEYEFITESAIETFTLPSADGGNGALSYELSPSLPEGIVFDEATLTISGTPEEAIERTAFTWTVQDIDGDSDSFTFYLTVIENGIPFFTGNPTVTAHEFIVDSDIESIALPRGMGGNGTLSYALNPTLPDGLALKEDAFEITGTPEQAFQRTRFTWAVSDSDGDTAVFAFFITVLEDLMPTLTGEMLNTEYEFIANSIADPIGLPRAMSGNEPLSYDLKPALPDGLVLNKATFEISGTPIEAHARTQYTWSVQDIDTDSDVFSFYITVLEDLMPVFVGDTANTEYEVVSDSAIMPIELPRATGGNGTLSYKLAPTLPQGLELNQDYFNISGTPGQAFERTHFTWSVQDIDGDSSTFSFYLTVVQDTMPVFSAQVADKVFTVGEAIDAFTLPTATGGNGVLEHELMPQLPDGVDLNTTDFSVSGIPVMDMPSTKFTWKATDTDGDSTSLSFSILVHPLAPMVVGSIPNVILFVGGESQSVNAQSTIEGTVSSWQIAVDDQTVASASVSTAGNVMLTPRIEGQTNVTLMASNTAGSVQLTFSVNVATDTKELDQIDSALALNAGGILSGAMNVFKRRSNLRGESNSIEVSGSAMNHAVDAYQDGIYDQPPWRESTSEFNPTTSIGYSHSSQRSSMASNWLSPFNFMGSAGKWSIWGAADLQNFSTDTSSNELDGSLTNLYFGADIAASENTFLGVAVASHGSSLSYEFSSADASGEGEIDTTLTSFYPYLQTGDGSRFSAFLVGGFGSGEAELERRHAGSAVSDADADLSLFAGGFDYLILQRESIDLSIVGDTGVATITTESDSGLLAARDISSSKSSIGGNVSFSQLLDTGSLVTSLDVRLATGSDDEDSRTGFELGGNLNYVGDHINLMLDARTSSRSGDADAQKSSISARLRYSASSDGTGLQISLSPKWQNVSMSSFVDPLIGIGRSSKIGAIPTRAVESEIRYGIWTNRERGLIQPSIAWTRLTQDQALLRLGTEWQFKSGHGSRSRFAFNLFKNTARERNVPLGFEIRIRSEI